jgi:hypothetical protein
MLEAMGKRGASMAKLAAFFAISASVLSVGAGTALGVNLGTSNGLTYMYKTAPLPVGGGGEKVNCPGKEGVTGGGALVSDDTDYRDSWLNDSAPMPAGRSGTPDEGWIASANKFEPARALHVYAICSNKSSKLEYVHRKARLPDGPSDQAHAQKFARCPRETTLAGGGAFMTGPGTAYAYIHSSSPDPTSPSDIDEGWYAQVQAWVSRPDTFLHVYAICSRQVSKYSYVIEQASIPPDGDQQAVEVATCPAGTAVSGGGARATAGPRLAWIHSSSPQPAGVIERPDDGWIGTAKGLGAVAQDLLVYAICKR